MASLLEGSYQPQPGAGSGNPQAGRWSATTGHPHGGGPPGAARHLQVLDPLLDPTFSESSYGFRPGRNAHQAQEYVGEGREIVVDLDLEKFFDRVNHDILLSRLARRVADKRLLRMVRRFLEAGMMQNGVCVERYEGTPQGGPLSPLLSNLLLDDLDQELERQGHRFCRYADDCNIYVRSQAAGGAGNGVGEQLSGKEAALARKPGRKVRWPRYGNGSSWGIGCCPEVGWA